MSCPLYVADQSERNYPAGNPKHCGACVTNLRDTKGTPEWPANFGQTCTTTEHSALFLIRSHTGTLSLSCALSSQPTIRGISSSGFPGAAFVQGKTIHALPLSDRKSDDDSRPNPGGWVWLFDGYLSPKPGAPRDGTAPFPFVTKFTRDTDRGWHTFFPSSEVIVLFF